MDKENGTLMLIITNQCNLRCTYCYENHEFHGVIPLEIAQKEIKNVLTNDTKYKYIVITLFGGEPFLYFERVKEICEWTWSIEWPVKYLFSFSTNGTVLNNEMKSWLRKNRDKITLVLSADGAKESQNMNRTESFDKIDFDFFKQTWLIPQVKMTVSIESLSHLAENVIFFHKRGFEFADCRQWVLIGLKKRT